MILLFVNRVIISSAKVTDNEVPFVSPILTRKKKIQVYSWRLSEGKQEWNLMWWDTIFLSLRRKIMDQLEPRAKAMDNQCAGQVRKRTHWGRARQKEKIQGDEPLRSKSAENGVVLNNAVFYSLIMNNTNAPLCLLRGVFTSRISC